MESSYRPLGAYLVRQPGPTCSLTVAEVEALLGRPLPPSARTRRTWWANYHAHNHCYHGWLAVGWRSEAVDMAGQRVTFRKG
jgi:hypothetical protein